MKLNVMAASGALGRRVIRELRARGIACGDIIASVRTPERAGSLAAAGIDVRRADYDDMASLQSAFTGTDTLLLIPSIAPVEPRILQHDRALTAARNAGVRRVLFSSLVTAGRLDSRFAVTPFLLYAESKLRQSGMQWTILRNGMYFDPVVNWVPELKAMGRLPYPVRSGRVAYVARDDLARATAGAMVSPVAVGEVYELTGPEALTMEALARAIEQAVGTPISFDPVSDEEYADICRRGSESVPEYLIDMLTTIYHAVDNGEFETVTDHVEKLSGTPPRTVAEVLQA